MNQRQRDDLFWELFGNTSALRATFALVRRQAVALTIVCAILVACYALDAYAGLRAQPVSSGALVAHSLEGTVLVRRDVRGVPHVTASSEHDVFFAQGFVEGSDRLFQMELTRRYAVGTLAEVFGPKALPIDESQRSYDIRDAAQRQLRLLSPRERGILLAYSAGVNAAIRMQPLPVEFRLLMFRPEPWTPRDSLAVSLAVSIALADSWRDVLARNDVWQRVGPKTFDQYVPLTDPQYDVSIRGAISAHRSREVLAFKTHASGSVSTTQRLGSDAWAAGAARTSTRRALLANDPHLDLTIPGLWYLLDLKAPGFHAAGAAIPGVPGILLGHNEHVAWGATNSDASATTLFFSQKRSRNGWTRETFHVRFGKDAAVQYYRTSREFGVPCSCASGAPVLVRWPLYYREPAIATFLGLDRARNVREAMAVLSRYRGTSENFVVADSSGQAAYHLAGGILNDPAWGRYIHPARDRNADYRIIPFRNLPSVPSARNAIVISANNKMYGDGYPYRLAATFDPPYRAYRISQMLHANRRYDVSNFSRMQLDTFSPVDLEFARTIGKYASSHLTETPTRTVRELAAWNGDFTRTSVGATTEHAVRTSLEEGAPSLFAVMQQLRSGESSPYLDDSLRGALFYANGANQTWAKAGEVALEHPLAPLWFGFLNGGTLPGDGDEYTVHLQEQGFGQSFRAVWDVGNWDAGGISIPSGESGEPGSGHYTDLTPSWIAGSLEPLPFSERAVERATRQRLTLLPR